MRDRRSAGRTCNREISGICWESKVRRRSSLLEGALDGSQSEEQPWRRFSGRPTEEDDGYGNEDHKNMVIAQEWQDP